MISAKKKLVSLKHGVRAINQTENSTDHLCEDTRQNALAALTNLGHVTSFLLLRWVREITSLDSKLPDQTEVHIRTELSSDPVAERNRSHSSRFICTVALLTRLLKKPLSMITVS